MIYGFNVGVNKSIQQMANKKSIPIKLHKVIYKLIDDLKEELSNKLPPKVKEDVIGMCHNLFIAILNVATFIFYNIQMK